MNSAVLMRENVAEKSICEKHIDLTTSADRLLDNHVVYISEHRKFCDHKMSAQSNQKMVFKRITPH